jgi:hypothetical protein
MALDLQNCTVMTQKITKNALFKVGLLVALCSGVPPISLTAQAVAQERQAARQQGAAISTAQVVAKFEGRVKEYARLREQLEEKLPKLSKDATPEQIKAHKTAFEEIVRNARVGAKQGDLFTPEAAGYIRTLISNEYKGQRLKELREEIMEAETQGVPLKVNYTYPESKELTQIPPTLLLKLPQLPKQVRYRFVGRHMLLVDRENGLIVDYMMNALP